MAKSARASYSLLKKCFNNLKELFDNHVIDGSTHSDIRQAIANETAARSIADNALQGQINTNTANIELLNNITTIRGNVDTYAKLQALNVNTLKIRNGDSYIVEKDETWNGYSSVYTYNNVTGWVWTGQWTVQMEAADGNKLGLTQSSNDITFTAGEGTVNAEVIAAKNITIVQSDTRSNLTITESIKTSFGKIWKWLNDLKTVAFTANYSDLTNVPTKLSQFNNDAGYIANKSPIELTFSSIINWDQMSGNIANILLSGNAVLNLQNAVDGSCGVLKVVQDSIGARTINLPGILSVNFQMSTAPNEITILTFVKIGDVVLWDSTKYGIFEKPWTSLVFGTSVNMTQISGVLKSTASGWNAGGAGAYSIPAGKDFALCMKKTSDSINMNGALGVHTTDNFVSFPGMAYGMYMSNLTIGYAKAQGASLTGNSTSPNWSIGEWVGIRRINGILDIVRSTDGKTFTTIETFSTPNNNNLYVVCNVYQGYAIYYPQIKILN